MIRRDDRGDWLIIDQIEHARLAAEIAAVWTHNGMQLLSDEDNRLACKHIALKMVESTIPKRHLQTIRDHNKESGASLSVASALWTAVSLHDNGWARWDKSPRIDPATGVPRSFLEMRMQDATAIWTQSIDICSDVPIAGNAVSRHFCFLAEQAREGGRHDSDDIAAIEAFLQQQERVQQQLAQAAWASGRGNDFDRCRELGFRMVRFFDRVSLWLCCSEEHESIRMTDPYCQNFLFIPTADSIEDDPPSSVFRMRISRPDYRLWNVAIDRYPVDAPSLELKTIAKRIPARRYIDDADFHSTLQSAPAAQLSWRIGPQHGRTPEQ